MTIPAGAKQLLDFIASFEAPHGYGTVYGNHQSRLAKPLTSMTLDEVIAAGPTWTKSFGSSACGRYQFMRDTLRGLKTEMKLSGREVMDGEFQDRLGYHLLQRRGFDQFVAGVLKIAGFGLKIAQEWASFPVLTNCQGAHRAVARGQSYYAGDGLNKALVHPEAVENVLAAILKTPTITSPTSTEAPKVSAPAPRVLIAPPKPDVPVPAPSQPAASGGFFARVAALFRKA